MRHEYIICMHMLQRIKRRVRSAYQPKRLSQEHINIPGHGEIPHIFVEPQQHPEIAQEIASGMRSEGTGSFSVSPAAWCSARVVICLR